MIFLKNPFSKVCLSVMGSSQVAFLRACGARKKIFLPLFNNAREERMVKNITKNEINEGRTIQGDDTSLSSSCAAIRTSY